MAQPPVVTAGDDISLTTTLYEAGAVYNAATATIKAALQDGSGRTLVDSVSQSSGTTGANWTLGVIVCEFAAATTGALIAGDAYLEIQVTTAAGKLKTWPLIPLTVQVGVIS